MEAIGVAGSVFGYAALRGSSGKEGVRSVFREAAEVDSGVKIFPLSELDGVTNRFFPEYR